MTYDIALFKVIFVLRDQADQLSTALLAGASFQCYGTTRSGHCASHSFLVTFFEFWASRHAACMRGSPQKTAQSGSFSRISRTMLSNARALPCTTSPILRQTSQLAEMSRRVRRQNYTNHSDELLLQPVRCHTPRDRHDSRRYEEGTNIRDTLSL